MYYSKKDVRPSFQRSRASYSLTRRSITQCWNSITLRRFHADRIWYENRQKPRAGALGWVVVAFEYLEDEGVHHPLRLTSGRVGVEPPGSVLPQGQSRYGAGAPGERRVRPWERVSQYQV